VRCNTAENKRGKSLQEYAEDLPPSCPPEDANDVAHVEVYRFLESGNAAPKEFLSHAARKKQNRTNIDPCGFASCSLLGDWEKYLKNIPNMRKAHSHVARLTIPEGIGMTKPKAKNGTVHFDFWCFAGKDLSNCVVEVLPLPPEDDADG
jgi:hypothetical protein